MRKIAGILSILLLIGFSGNARGEQAGTSFPSSGVSDPAPSQGTSVTGDTLTMEVPYSQESFDQSKANEAILAGPPASPRVVPFHHGPPPIERPGGAALPALPPSAQEPLAPAPLAPALSNGFQGLIDTNTFIPPDTMGAAGPSHLMSTLNTGVGIFNKTTGNKISEVTLQAFWAALGTGAGQPANDPFDPKIIYDQYAGRFIVVTLGGGPSPNSWLMIAVSATSDPNGTWYKWAIDADKDNNQQLYNNWADYPGLGIDAFNVYITGNMFDSTGTYQYSKVWVIPKPQLISGASTITWTEFRNPPGSYFVMQPAHTFGSAAAEYFIFEEGYTTEYYLLVAKIDNVSGTPVWHSPISVGVASYSTSYSLPGAPQAGDSRTISTNDTRLMNAVYRNGSLWTTHNVAVSGKVEVAWYQVNPVAGTTTSQGRIKDPSRWYYFPSIAVNTTGDAAIGFTGSSTTEYAGAFYTGRSFIDPPGAMQPVATLKAGLAPYFKDYGSGRNRWGDYSATCVDPNDDRTFWTLQEYANTPANNWATWWGSFKFHRSSAIDFEGDGKTDPAIYRPSNGYWVILQSSNNYDRSNYKAHQ